MKTIASYLKVPYDLRPAKQIERRMLIEAFQTLSHLGFPISKYQYTGFGSIYFVDFILFHKLLGINRLLSVEIDKRIKKRVKFNQPFRCVDVRIGRIGDVIPYLSRTRKHILWLDYDSVLRREHVEDIWLAAAHLPRHSVVLVTLDVEPPIKEGKPEQWREHFMSEAGNYLGSSIDISAFAQSKLLLLNRDIMMRVLKSGLASRSLQFLPLFSFSYADGHEMLTLGGMIGTSDDAQSISRSALNDFPYIRLKEQAPPFRILVPMLTRKERMHLDKSMPAGSTWKLRNFELPEEFISAYRQVYRYMPTYAELLL